jgi:hypothetical protein
MKRYSLILMAMIVVAITSTVCHAQRYRSGTVRMYNVSYEKSKPENFLLLPVKNDKTDLVQLELTSLKKEPIASLVIDLVIVFRNGETMILHNNPFEKGQKSFVTYFDLTKKNRKILLSNELNFWEVRYKATGFVDEKINYDFTSLLK